MSNATATSRLAFQSSTTNGNTIIQAIPNGTATQTNLLLYANTDLSNSAALNIFQNATESTIRGIALGTGAYTPLTFYTGGSERMRLDTSGNLGIGTASPTSSVLHVVSPTASAKTPIKADNPGNTQYGVTFQGRTTGGSDAPAISLENYNGGSPVRYGMSVTSGGALAFSSGLYEAAAGTERMRIDSSGNVGIGTASPASKLDINTGGSTGTTDLITLSGLDSTSAKQTYATIRVGIESSTAGSESGNLHLQTVESGTVRDRIYMNGTGYMTFLNGGIERMRITSAGNVGIGTNAPTDFGGKNLSIVAQASNAYASTLWVSGAYTMEALVNEASNVMSFGSRSNHKLDLCTNDTTRVSISNAGNVTMSGSLSMSGQITTRTTTGTTPIVNGGGSNSLQVMGDVSNGAWFSFHRSGAYAINMGLDTSNVLTCGGWSDGANYRWQVDASGNFTARGNVTAYSDERVKKNWRPVQENLIEKISAVKSGVYDRTDADLTQVGVSAQSLREVLPEAVLESNGGELSVAYGNAALVAVIELAKEVVKLRAEVEALKAAK
jgi:hypothetical protein